jgi:hypothetical protein
MNLAYRFDIIRLFPCAKVVILCEIASHSQKSTSAAIRRKTRSRFQVRHFTGISMDSFHPKSGSCGW